ncbi:hypothetical protein EJ03DRAFT_323480 [Teratosphaeria nubilosa]|uniref:Uncharacterized protein n=1 Tax=Teratosphaeria nubilosa TaxID=161662 RepID=A0A6G1LKU4_9PEZI|nr:hypothetical protein EJ03DRAFT_323480 [Teratosphaeria nubilosa]
MSFTAAHFLLEALSGTIHAWGNLGHQTVAYIAQNYVKDSTASWAREPCISIAYSLPSPLIRRFHMTNRLGFSDLLK